MHKFLLALACLTHHAHARRVRQNSDTQDRISAIANLLLAVNPSLSQAPSRITGALRTKAGHYDQQSAGVASKTPLLEMRGGSMAVVPSDETWESLDPTLVQGGALRTWSFQDSERLLVTMSGNDRSLTNWVNEGRLMNVRMSLCEGPDNTPVILTLKSGKGVLRPFKGIIETPGPHCSLFIRNIGTVEFPVKAAVAAQMREEGPELVSANIHEMVKPYKLQGSSITSYPLERNVKMVKVLINTDGRPMNAKIELLMGPNSARYELDIYSENGKTWPLCVIIETPGQGNTIRVVNTASYEFPLTVDVQPITS